MENPFKKSVENETEEKINEEIKEEATAQEVTEEETPIEENVTEEVNPWQTKYEELNNQYVRLAADFDNYRKRQEQERENLLKYGAENTVKKFLEVLDNFDRGIQAISTVDDCEKVKECYNLAYKNFNEVLTKVGVEAIKAVGEDFDPNLHEAVMQTPSSEHKEHTIIAELQKGYKLGDKVLRPTLVNVATAE